jgi:hypothetical protein
MKGKKFYIQNKIVSIIFILLTVVGHNSCQKSPINGHLDGQWQLMTVEPAPTETSIDERLYYCFSLHTVQLTAYDMGPVLSGNILKFDDNTLVLEFPYATSNSQIVLLRQYGISTNPVSFTIEHLDKNRLVLKENNITITLRKF